MILHWQENQQRIQVLLDTGRSIPLINQQLVERLGIITDKHQWALTIEGYMGQVIKGAGHRYTRPMRLQHRRHFTEESFEVSPMEQGIDVFLPYWWIAKHPPQNKWDSSELRFDHPDCLSKCTRYGTGDFSLTWDETVCVDPEARTVGYVSTVTEQNPLENMP